VPEVWLVDLEQERIEVYRRPEEGEYAEVTRCERGSLVTPEAFPELQLAVEEICGLL
jgi:Uma2 family endonuclease